MNANQIKISEQPVDLECISTGRQFVTSLESVKRPGEYRSVDLYEPLLLQTLE